MIFEMFIIIAITLLRLLFLPLNLLISVALPALVPIFASLDDYFEILFSQIAWGISLVALPATAVALIISYYTIKLTYPIYFWLFKNVLHWVQMLKWW